MQLEPSKLLRAQLWCSRAETQSHTSGMYIRPGRCGIRLSSTSKERRLTSRKCSRVSPRGFERLPGQSTCTSCSGARELHKSTGCRYRPFAFVERGGRIKSWPRKSPVMRVSEPSIPSDIGSHTKSLFCEPWRESSVLKNVKPINRPPAILRTSFAIK
jgi:hypothetical protein